MRPCCMTSEGKDVQSVLYDQAVRAPGLACPLTMTSGKQHGGSNEVEGAVGGSPLGDPVGGIGGGPIGGGG
jgi:hypothetical protein